MSGNQTKKAANRLFFSILSAQAFIFLILLTGLMIFQNVVNDKETTDLINKAFSEYELKITEGIFLREKIGDNNFDGVVSLKSFKESLEHNDVSALIKVANCSELPQGELTYRLKVANTTKLNNCVQVIPQNNFLSRYYFIAIGLISLSFAFSILLWFFTRKKLLTKILDPLLNVAHDIRSPLAALKVAVNSLNIKSQEDERLIINNSINRIGDIANNILNDNISEVVSKKRSEVDTHQLTELVDSIVSEKRTLYKDRMGLEIEFYQSQYAYNAFIKVSEEKFKRMLSNLIENAVDATETGKIIVEVFNENKFAVIKVKDSGSGIPEKILDKLLVKEFSRGKLNGNGLGLMFCKNVVEEINGDIKIESLEGEGTTVNLKLPKADPPSWVVSSIAISQNTEIIITDDDTSIHQLWDNRLIPIKNKIPNLKVKHLSSPESFHAFMRNHSRDEEKEYLFLFDYDFHQKSETGLDLIKKYKLSKSSILITGHYSECGVRENCEKLGVRLIPKSALQVVPLKALKDIEIVHYDDEEIVRASWKLEARRKKVGLLSVGSYEELMSSLNSIPKGASFFIDQNLGASKKGLEVTKELFIYGFKNLYISTGFSRESIPTNDSSHLKGVIGKAPIF